MTFHPVPARSWLLVEGSSKEVRDERQARNRGRRGGGEAAGEAEGLGIQQCGTSASRQSLQKPRGEAELPVRRSVRRDLPHRLHPQTGRKSGTPETASRDSKDVSLKKPFLK